MGLGVSRRKALASRRDAGGQRPIVRHGLGSEVWGMDSKAASS